MKNTILILFSLTCWIRCEHNNVCHNEDDVCIMVENLDSLERNSFNAIDCKFNSDIVIRKIIITNCKYDTLRLWTFDYCHPNAPFITYDAIDEYLGDTLVSTDLIFTKSGYPIEILKNESKKIFNRSRVLKKDSKYKYTFWAEVDSSNFKKAVEFHFFESCDYSSKCVSSQAPR